MIGLVSSNEAERIGVKTEMSQLGLNPAFALNTQDVNLKVVNDNDVKVLIVLSSGEDLSNIYNVDSASNCFIVTQEIEDEKYKTLSKKVWLKKLLKRAGFSMDQARQLCSTNTVDESAVEVKAEADFDKLWIIGASTGSPNIISKEIMPIIGAPLNCATVVAIHMGRFMINYVQNLKKDNPALNIYIAEDGSILKNGDICFCPHDKTLGFTKDGRISLKEVPSSFSFTPPIDDIGEQAVETFSDSANLIILSGQDKDGAKAAELVHKAGGKVWVQDPTSAVASDMPYSTLEAVPSATVLETKDIGLRLISVLGQI